jgi:electron transfer flavoprotein beta subunit
MDMKPPLIIVCLKTVPDPEGPASAFEIRSDLKKVVPSGIPPVINPYDENALEAALRLKDRWGGRVVVVNVSEKPMVSILRKVFAVRADDLILVEDPNFKDLTGLSTARVLCAAIKKIGSYELILTGRQTTDWESGQVGMLVAETLKIPAVNLAQSLILEDGKAVVEKLKRRCYEVVRTTLPALVTVSSEFGELRLPTLRAIQETKKKPVTVWKADDLGIDPGGLKQMRVRELTPPPSRARICNFVEGDSSQAKGRNLAFKLREDRIL